MGEIISNQKAVLPCKENFQSTWSNREYSVSVETNNLGLRSDRKTDLQKTDVAFFGDSFTFGHGVEKEERFSEIVEQKIKKYDGEIGLLENLKQHDSCCGSHVHVCCENLKHFVTLMTKIFVL